MNETALYIEELLFDGFDVDGISNITGLSKVEIIKYMEANDLLEYDLEGY